MGSGIITNQITFQRTRLAGWFMGVRANEQSSSQPARPWPDPHHLKLDLDVALDDPTHVGPHGPEALPVQAGAGHPAHHLAHGAGLLHGRQDPTQVWNTKHVAVGARRGERGRVGRGWRGGRGGFGWKTNKRKHTKHVGCSGKGRALRLEVGDCEPLSLLLSHPPRTCLRRLPRYFALMVISRLSKKENTD